MRPFLLSFLTFIFCSTYAQEKKIILFVCEHGGARSTIASVYFNKLAKENHLPYESAFLGLTPDSVITKETKTGLKQDGFDTTPLKTTPFRQGKIPPNALLISLDCSIPTAYPTYRDWKGIPAISENYSAARNEILKLVNELVKELKPQDHH